MAPQSATYAYDNLGRLLTSNQTSNGAAAQCEANIGIDPGPYGVRWIDTPNLRDRSDTKPPAMVAGADLTWTFQFKGIAPDGTTGCGGGFTLHLKFGPGDDPNKGWSITGQYTF